MTPRYTHDITISGAGMVGLSLAIACAIKGLKVAIIEHKPEPALEDIEDQFSARVSAINLSSENFLTNIDAWKYIPTHRICHYQSMHVWDQLGHAELNFDARSVQQLQLGHIIENRFITAALRQRASELPSIEFFAPDTIEHWSQDRNCVQLQTKTGKQLTSKVLVACEGRQSNIREQSIIDSWQWSYDHTAIVTTVKHQNPHKGQARQVFLDTGPLAFLPLKDANNSQTYSSIVWSAKTPRAEQLMALSTFEFITELSAAFEDTLGEIIAIDPLEAYPLTALQAKSYIDNRIVLVGDTGHSIHPLAGLGVNLGFLDAATLASEWHRALARQIDIAEPAILRRYQRQRQLHNLTTAGLMEALKRTFDSQSSAPVLLRNIGLDLINKNNLAKRPLIEGALGILGTNTPELCKTPRL